MVKRIVGALAALTLSAGLVTATAPTAYAHHTCDSGEICLYDWHQNLSGPRITTKWSLKNYLAHNWYGAGGTESNDPIIDDVNTAKNRGTACAGCEDVVFYQGTYYSGAQAGCVERGTTTSAGDPLAMYLDYSASHTWGSCW